MMRSLYSGVSGLRVHQTKMDVIGNNISNVNTVGFKASKVSFSDIFYQNLQSASGPNATTGATGQNGKQIGLGANLASIRTQMTTHGGAQRTDDSYSMMISNDAFFIVRSGGVNYFTKAGNFEEDANGMLCLPNGANVMGWEPDPNDPTKISPGAVSPIKINTPENQYTSPEATKAICFSGNIDPKDSKMETGLTKQMQFYDSLGNLYTAQLKFKQALDSSGAPVAGQYTIDVTDVLDENNESIFLTKGADGAYVKKNPEVTIKLGDVEYKVKDFDNKTGKVTLDGKATADNTLVFDTVTGALTKAGKGVTTPKENAKALAFEITPNGANQAGQKQFEIVNMDFSNMTMFAKSGTTSSIESKFGDIDGLDGGKKAGKMIGFSTTQSGMIYGTYDNGDLKLLGQIAVATFSNPAGLEAVGNNMFAETQNSGHFDGVGQDITTTGGTIQSSVLEMSNVDLSQEFTDMITTQRGFQANSRIITTSDSLLEELINLKR